MKTPAKFAIGLTALVVLVALARLSTLGPTAAPESPPPPPPPPVRTERVFFISAQIHENSGFNVSEIRVQRGDHVVLVVTSLDTTHGILLDLPWVSISNTVPPGQTERVEFDAEQTGTFTIYCPNPLCSAEHYLMRIALVIE